MFAHLLLFIVGLNVFVNGNTCDPSQFTAYNAAIKTAEQAYLTSCKTEAEKAGLIQPNSTLSAASLDPKLCQVQGCYSLFGATSKSFPDCSKEAGQPTLYDMVNTEYKVCKETYTKFNSSGNQACLSMIIIVGLILAILS